MSAAKERGTKAERLVVGYLQGIGWPYAERRALAGKNDRGDVAGIIGVTIEVKNAQRMELAAWLDEAVREAAATNDLAVVWHKKRGKALPADWYVTMTGAAFVELLKEGGYR